MSLFSFLRKNKQESASGESTFYSRAEEDSKAVRSRGKRRGGKDSREDEALDPVLPEKKRARRRLIGAVALVLAAVIGLPMVLDSEPKPLADDIAIQIPSKDKPAAGAIARTDAPSTSKIAASASLDAKEEVVETPAPAEKETYAAAPADPPKAKDDAKAADHASKASDKTASPVIAKAEPKSADAHDKSDKSDDARAKALLEGKPDPKAAEKKPGKYVIQVAALATKEKVDELQGKLKGAGIKSYTEKIATASGDRTRIRVGPFASKEEAEKAKAKIVKIGLNGTLVPA
ncbi:SPOR domain-containing protein [Noviherbaspirillum sp. ST9]|uniref:SPOR domain-containing protein n=1 Tax=Noviherbaspirillum sp. ST9 TaxID=3401606 RepID=UPI003B58A878